MANYTNYWYIISLRIRHPTRSLDHLGAELNLTPSRVSRAGAPRTSPRGAPLSGVYAENFWTASILEGVLTDRDLAAAITVALDQQAAVGRSCPSAGSSMMEIAATSSTTNFWAGWPSLRSTSAST